MNLESMIGGLNHAEMLAAMDLIWTRLTENPSEFESPAWHEDVLKQRMNQPSDDSLPLDQAIQQVRERLNERRTQK